MSVGDAEKPPGLTMIVDVNDGEEDETTDMLRQVAADMGMGFQIGKIVACGKCQHFSCVCDVLAAHIEGCIYRLAVTCAIPIACEKHGCDVCPECGDVCTCDEVRKAKGTPP